MALHRIKPGITELAQISGCRGETETIDKMQKRVEMDFAYINNWSIWLDLKILIKPPFTRRMTRGYRHRMTSRCEAVKLWMDVASFFEL